MLRVEDIRIYPVKGLRGFSVPEAEVEPWGLADDRRWMVVDAAGGFVTQRQIPRMAVLRAEALPGGLRLAAEGAAVLEEPLPSGTATARVSVWDDLVEVREGSDGAAAWLTRTLGVPCRLVQMHDPAMARPSDPEFSRPADRVSFADGFPLLATTTASLDDLNRRLNLRVDMDRFRANLVVGGAEAWAEDRWARISVGRAAFEAVKDCARCVVTTVDQRTGLKANDAEPLRTLGTFRRKAGGRIIFGQNLIPRSLGRVRVGDLVEVEARC